jgi:hypothetical protein
MSNPTVGRPIGQHEPLNVRLRNLIRGYPKGVGIIKEFLQNADDASATRVDIVMDWQVYPTSLTPGPQYAGLAGPALLIANDAPFAEDDFKGIQSLGQSGKQLASTKIGKFGLGFNAAYNVTDHPTFLSRDQLYLFDPSRTIVGEAYKDAGIAFDIVKDKLWSVYPGLLLPFCAAGLREGQSDLPRTIFRLPLRTKALAAQSTITQEPFEAADFEDILAQLGARAPELLLFLQHVLTLRVVVTLSPDLTSSRTPAGAESS